LKGSPDDGREADGGWASKTGSLKTR